MQLKPSFFTLYLPILDKYKDVIYVQTYEK